MSAINEHFSESPKISYFEGVSTKNEFIQTDYFSESNTFYIKVNSLKDQTFSKLIIPDWLSPSQFLNNFNSISIKSNDYFTIIYHTDIQSPKISSQNVINAKIITCVVVIIVAVLIICIFIAIFFVKRRTKKTIEISKNEIKEEISSNLIMSNSVNDKSVNEDEIDINFWL